jgi:hypothetical protein
VCRWNWRQFPGFLDAAGYGNRDSSLKSECPREPKDADLASDDDALGRIVREVHTVTATPAERAEIAPAFEAVEDDPLAGIRIDRLVVDVPQLNGIQAAAYR